MLDLMTKWSNRDCNQNSNVLLREIEVRRGNGYEAEASDLHDEFIEYAVVC